MLRFNSRASLNFHHVAFTNEPAKLITLFNSLNPENMLNDKSNLLLKVLCFCTFIFVTSFSDNQQDNVLTPAEKKAGWILLFDGKTTNGWRTYKNRPGSWEVKNGELICPLGAKDYADLVTTSEYDNFELTLDWKIDKGSNSGIMYHVLETHDVPYATGPEYQLVDDNGYEGKLETWQKSGSDYAMHAPSQLTAKPAGEYNHTKIVFNKGHVEHWLNGVKVADFTAWSPEWDQLRSASKWKDYPDYGQSKTGLIAFQGDHKGGVWFKNIKIRKL